MTKERIIQTTNELTIYEFYCDKCNKYLGCSKECDGYYVRFGEIEENIYINGNWYTLNKTLCECCKNKFYKDFIKKLTQIGFKIDD